MVWAIREADALKPKYVVGSSLFTIEYHHGGNFQRNGDEVIRYVDGSVDYFDNCDTQTLSILSLLSMAGRLGWLDVKRLFYKRVGSDFATDMYEINQVEDAVDLGKFIDTNRVVEVYAEGCGDGLDDSDSSKGSDGDDIEWEGVEKLADIDILSGSDKDEGREEDDLIDLDIQFENSFDIQSSSKCPPKGKEKATTKDFRDTTKDGDNLDNLGTVNDGCVDSDGVLSDGSDVDNIFGKSDLNNVKFRLGLRFATPEDFRDAIRMYSFQNGKDIKYKKNTRGKMSCYCKNETKNGNTTECSWYLYASKVRDEVTIQVKTYIDNHTCPRTQDISACKPKFIAKQYEERIRLNPKWAVPAFQKQVARDLGCQVKLPKAYKAFKMAKTKLQGNPADQYLHLWDYIEEMKRTNIGTTVELKVAQRPNQDFAIFRRIYICWGPLKRGFLVGCRPLIGLDGTHLSGPHRGILLTAVAVDPNNCIYPFAYAVVDTESYSTWKWFIKLLCIDLNIERTEDYTIISDKQKGLIKAVEKLLPGIEHRFCVLHLYNNFNKIHKGIALKELLEKAARATTIPQFERALEEMKIMDVAAWKWLSSKPGMNWSMSHFSTHTKSGMLLNNLCESFNSCIKDYRCQPILSMLEGIRLKLMDLVMRKKEAAKRVNTMEICPKIREKLDKLKLYSHEWVVFSDGDLCFEVEGPNDKKYAVSLVDKSCGCRSWQLTGIPCVHGIACIYRQGEEPEAYVHQCYSIETYKKVYSNVMKPMNGRELWPRTKNRILLPPIVRQVKLGRPPKVRRRGLNEPKQTKLRKTGLVMKCTKCGNPGHNSRTCGKPKKMKGKGKGNKAKKPEVVVEQEGLVDESGSSEEENVVNDEGVANEGVAEGMVEVEVANEGVANEGVAEGMVEVEVANEGVAEYQWVNEDHVESIWHDMDPYSWASQPVESTAQDWTESTRKQSSSQGVGTLSKLPATKAPLRRSSRIQNSPKKGPIEVQFQDLTEDIPDTQHCGIVPKGKGKMKKGIIQKGGKRYMTSAALLADLEHQKKAKNFAM